MVNLVMSALLPRRPTSDRLRGITAGNFYQTGLERALPF